MTSDISLGRRQFLWGTAATTVALGLNGIVARRSWGADPQAVNMQLGWLIDYNQTGEIVAQELGYFDKEGLKLVIQPGGSNIDGVAIVASGQCQVGQIPSSPSLMLASSHGIPVTAFAVGAQRHPFAFFSLPKNPVRTPQDMVGKKIGIQSTSQILLNALLKKNNVDPSKVEVVPIGYDMVPLLSGQVDAISGWVIDVSVLKALGPDFITMSIWDYGIHLYSDVYYTTHDAIQKNPEQLTKFLRATARGWQFTYRESGQGRRDSCEGQQQHGPEGNARVTRQPVEIRIQREDEGKRVGNYGPRRVAGADSDIWRSRPVYGRHAEAGGCYDYGHLRSYSGCPPQVRLTADRVTDACHSPRTGN